MFNLKNQQQNAVPRPPNFLRLFFFYLTLCTLFFSSVVLAASHPCEKASLSLRGDLDAVLNRGGFWSLMEQKGLKENSMIGMQADGKLARVVAQFETLCKGDKKPKKPLFIAIQNLLGDARVMMNPRSSSAKIAQSIIKLNKELDTLLAKIE